jgi:hypothetical protein
MQQIQYMQQPSPITFRDAVKFSKMANRMQFCEINPKTSRDFKNLNEARASLQEFSEKLVNKSAPERLKYHKKTEFFRLPVGADKVQLSALDYQTIATKLSNVSDNQLLCDIINDLNKYKKSDEAKFSLKGQTFSSVWDHFAINSHTIATYQGRIAQLIYETISNKIDESIRNYALPEFVRR